MKLVQLAYRFLLRFRYPVSLPQDVANALGIRLPWCFSFNKFLLHLTSPSCCATKLKRHMSREEAESFFGEASKKEFFHNNSHFFFYFNEGWMGITLLFDTSSRLRRVYLEHKSIKEEQKVEIPLS